MYLKAFQHHLMFFFESTCSDCLCYFDGNVLCGICLSVDVLLICLDLKQETYLFVMPCFYRFFLHVQISTITVLTITLY
jgi:hypothetical protein